MKPVLAHYAQLANIQCTKQGRDCTNPVPICSYKFEMVRAGMQELSTAHALYTLNKECVVSLVCETN